MFTSFADVFRTRQAVTDLLEVVHLHRNAVTRIGATGSDVASLDEIIRNGAIIPDEKARSYSSILFAAAMPDEDFNAFVAATAILLADRLQGGGGEEDLYWNYEAFREHYLLADAPVRAALMNGFRIAYLSGRSTLPEEPDCQSCLTRRLEDALHILESENASSFAETIRSEPTPTEAGRMWSEANASPATLSSRIGFRYLYERPASLTPEDPHAAKLIPWE